MPTRSCVAAAPYTFSRTAGGPRTLALFVVALLAGAALSVLLWSRLAGLDQSLWFDEAYTVERYVEPGPSGVFGASYLPNNHMLFSLLAWAAAGLAGESEVVYRLWSVVPALLTGLGVSVWLLRRHGAAAALTFLVLWTAAPLLTDLSRQARGYGLVFAGTALSLIAASQAVRHGFDRRRYAACVAGILVAALTQPVLVLPAAGVLLALLVARRTRRASRWLPVITGLPTLLWYWPVLEDLIHSSGQDFGAPLPWHALLTQPVKVLEVPGTDPSDFAHGSWSAVLAALLIAGAACTWKQSRAELLVLVLPVAVTLVGLTALRLFVVPRFLSFLFVPCAMLVATGVHVAAGWAARRSRTVARTSATAGVGAAALLLWSVVPLHHVLIDTPREAYKEAGSYVAGQQGRVVSNAGFRGVALSHYVPQKVEDLTTPDIEALACTGGAPLVIIDYPRPRPRLDVGCLEVRGTRTRFPQHAAPGYIDVWVLPARARPA